MIQASDLEVRPDEKGPKNLAILLFLSSLIVAGMGWQDWQLHNVGLSDEDIETFLATPNSQPGEPTTVEQYRDFEATSERTTVTFCEAFPAAVRLHMLAHRRSHVVPFAAKRRTPLHGWGLGWPSGRCCREHDHQQRRSNSSRGCDETHLRNLGLLVWYDDGSLFGRCRPPSAER